MRRRGAVQVGLIGAAVVPFALVVPSGADPSGTDALRADLDRILADPRLAGAHTGVVVRDPATDEVLYSRAADERAVPASTAKLATSAAALDVLGPEHRFRTEVRTDAPVDRPVLRGDLHLRGTGDPAVLPADLDRMAAEVADRGVRRVEGAVLADATRFDDRPLGTGWAWDDEPYHYAAPVSALTAAPDTDYDAGSAVVRVEPGAEGGPARTSVAPATGALQLDDRVRTAAPDTAPDVDALREHGTGRVVVTGAVPAGGPGAEEYVSVPDPAAYAVDLFVRSLAEHGVRVSGTGEGAAPPGSRVLAEHVSMPLRELLGPFLKLSNNGHAETLVKAMAAHQHGRGDWETGIPLLTERLAGFGVDPEAVRLVDGSGLSPMDQLTPGQLAELLDNVRQRPWFADWYAALPVAGAADRAVGGTLRHRMAGTAAEHNVHAKTGSMTGVSALSGYVTAADGRELVFSVVFNGVLSEPPHDVEDAIAVRLAEHGAERDRVRGTAPLPPAQRDDARARSAERELECSWTKTC
ncbi:D-alanyl-D-alanine carboxypeptidase/D-alanyl-D-alanine-endopeptidase [Saccharopolyspora sp. HNM0983]|uniref:D-alanyl-D-alanine carboxypeptidase/D-alanyl-D-alanine-endopeptidase n=1 Tax=Saccharopolyspora montiporae TaxID=2781240 RepID=A0A929BA06_9PSEU|nr:D-alanyl-D-alanine carboxypeptidase/D-alanyl-D-alanine-endopeptidase [Saccharopolyspora sp. HNM0983]MBE9374186.1 D-alanyl-D-alanine carboxypeptidase/D-alanyl-D-alanine-endopeptidase [Saccharopolyspora sp. HNM0983]